MECARKTTAGRLLSCASFSVALVLPRRAPPGIVQERLDYSKVPLSVDPDTAEQLGKKLAQDRGLSRGTIGPAAGRRRGLPATPSTSSSRARSKGCRQGSDQRTHVSTRSSIRAMATISVRTSRTRLRLRLMPVA